MVTLFYDAYRILNKVYSDGAYLSQAINSVQIEEKNRSKTTKICYGVLDRDIELEYYIDKLCSKKPKAAVRLMMKIAMYNIKFLSKKPYAVIDSMVELCKKMGKAGVSGFLNAVLRKFIDHKFQLPTDEVSALSVKYSYPIFAVNSLLNSYGKNLAEEIMAYDEVKTFVRFSQNFDGANYLVNKGIFFKESPFIGLYETDGLKVDEDFRRGVFTFQSIGSVAICNVLDGGEKLLDACAAPGGKSVFLSGKFKDVVSCEIHPHRVELIKNYAERMGIKNVTALNIDSSVFHEEFYQQFDAVLCDVPCSGYGTLKQNPDIKLRGGRDISQLTDLQYKIITNCSQYVKSGGVLVYSTCSVFKEENDLVVDKFLAKNKEFSICEISSPLNGIRTDFGMQFLPNISSGAGFYVSKLIKK